MRVWRRLLWAMKKDVEGTRDLDDVLASRKIQRQLDSEYRPWLRPDYWERPRRGNAQPRSSR